MAEKGEIVVTGIAAALLMMAIAGIIGLVLMFYGAIFGTIGFGIYAAFKMLARLFGL